jgi:hypothetical protein
MAEVPHLAWPFRLPSRGTGRRGPLAQVEQDSVEDVQQNVHSYLSTTRGERPLSPDFGLEDPTFGPGINATRIAADIEEAEDGRAVVEIAVVGPDANGETAVTVSVDLAD